MGIRTPLSLVTVAVVLAVTPTPAAATAEPPSPASGHAQVVAQGLAAFDDNPWHWQLSTIAVSAPAPLDTSSPVFISASGPAPLLVDDAAGTAARLAAGEAIFRPAGAPTQLRTLSPGGTAGMTITIAPGGGDGTKTFVPGASVRDVDLVRDVLSTNEALVLRTDVSALVLVTEGTVSVGGATMSAGGSAMLTGDITVINTSPVRAVVLVAVVGPALDGAPPPEVSSTVAETNPPDTQAPDTQPPSTTSDTGDETSTTTTTQPAGPTTTTLPDPTLDSDGDGLRDTDEIAFGSNPFDPDTDNDGLNDGEDRANGCSPTSYDTDGDGFSDGSEVNAGTNCAVHGS